ncbi:TIGR02444 family protein [Phytohalomonas tamaricis]|uniref:TIGR02444 family protein n=1 Tax=Phytohalomonas tamaricis TaxID=2081032 RepID=UPI00131A0A93|nr:TIGR02444 family protein [Phytohalomonas tamaricis]
MTAHFTELWPFALRLYAREGVSAACVRLQDEGGLDVCELLWLCWLAANHHTLAEPDNEWQEALGDVRHWQRSVTVPLRQQRRLLKPLTEQMPRLVTLRTHIKQAELEAEREALTRLETLARQGNGVRPANGTADLDATLAHWAGSLSADLMALLLHIAHAARADAEPTEA